VVGLVVGGGDEVPNRQEVVAGKVLVRRHVSASGRAYAVAVLRIPWGNRGSGATRSSMGVVAVSPVGASRCEATRAARRRSICAWRERWSEHHQCRGAEGPVASACAGVGASAAGVAGTGPGPVDRHGWSSARLVMRMR
jgi:hypothetical protein